MRAQALMAAADCLEQMVAAVAGEDVAARQRARRHRLLDAARDNDIPDTVRQPRWKRSDPAAALPRPGRRCARAPKPSATTRVPTQLLDDLVRMVGELTIKIGELEQELKSASNHSRQLVEQDRSIQKRLFELENSVDIRGVAARHKLHAVATATTARLRLAGNGPVQRSAVASRARLIEESTDARDLGVGLKDELAGLAGILHQQQRLMRELAHLTSQTRMAPVETIVPRLQRNVRQTAAATRKQAQLVVVGQDILVDAEVLNQLIDPLLHILRNAVDHGLESPDEREALGKPRAGTHQADRRAPRPGGHRAGGRRRPRPGSADIRSRAVERGLLAADAMPTDAEIARLTLLPGFSTRDMVTEISGRGVGLDVVATRLRALAGAIDIRSRRGRRPDHRAALPGLAGGHARAVRARRRPGIRHRQPRRATCRAGGCRLAGARERRRCTPTSTTHSYPAHELASLTGLAPAGNAERRNLVVADSDAGPVGAAGRRHPRRRRTRDAPRRALSQAHPGRRRYRILPATAA